MVYFSDIGGLFEMPNNITRKMFVGCIAEESGPAREWGPDGILGLGPSKDCNAFQ